jgi:hypothetical protein
MSALFAEKLRNNDTIFFKRFTKVRGKVEDFLIENKSLIGIILQNLGKKQRIPKMKEMFDYLVAESFTGTLTLEGMASNLGLKAKLLDVRAVQTSANVADETKNAVMVRTSIATAPKCPICHGRIEVNKSKSYGHIIDKKYDGTGDIDNIQLEHLYCNNSKDSLLA